MSPAKYEVKHRNTFNGTNVSVFSVKRKLKIFIENKRWEEIPGKLCSKMHKKIS
jgi:phosphatidylserine decarboxylase